MKLTAGLSRRKLIAAMLLGLATLSMPAHATLLFTGVDLGAAGRTTQWAIFALQGDVTIGDTTLQNAPVSPADPRLPSNRTVTSDPAYPGTANIGVGGGGSITLSGRAQVNGTAFLRTGGVLRRSGSASMVGGPLFTANNTPVYNNALMNQAVADATNASAVAALKPDYIDTDGINRTGWNSLTSLVQSTDAYIDDTLGGRNVVLNLTDFILTGGANLYLTGNSETTFIINVSGQFSLLGSKIVLSGVPYENVLFNVTGSSPSNASFSSGAEFNGVFLAPQRALTVSGASRSFGTLIARSVSVSGGSKINKPHFASP